MTSSPATMRAVQLSAPGPVGNLRLTTLPLPPERNGWVRIRVEAFGLNRSELKLRLGLSAGVSFPPVPGIEAAGTIDAAPPGSGLAPGQKVVAMMGPGAGAAGPRRHGARPRHRQARRPRPTLEIRT
jgi:NADPH:quinone reductase-like Zn-dependent oxidoreductase